MAIDSEARSSRRNILLAALGGAGAAIATRLGAPARAEAANGDAVTVGGSFVGTGATTLNVSATSGVAAFDGIAGDAIGVRGQAGTGTGVEGDSDSGAGVTGTSSTGPGLWGTSASSAGSRGENPDNNPSAFNSTSNKTGVLGTAGAIGTPGDPNSIAQATDETGVYGYANISANSTGMWGDSWDGTGVLGTGSIGVWGSGSIGVYGQADSASSYGLYTNGRIRFNGRSGRSSIGSGHSYKDVTISGMSSSSAVIATLQTHKSGFYVAAVVSYTGKFRMYLNKTATSTMYFSYIVIG